MFTKRDVKHRGGLQVQLVPHLTSVRHTERLTWRLLGVRGLDSATSRVETRRGYRSVVSSAVDPHTRNARAGMTRTRIVTTVAARAPLPFHKRPRKRNGCC